MKPRSRDKHKGRSSSGGWFFRIPAEVLNSPNMRMATTKAKAMLLDIGAQFRGSNNGDICITWSDLRQRGWKSKQTMERAMHELLRLGLIEQTRQGGLHCASLFAFTWQPIDPCGGKLDVPATAVASHRWRMLPQAVGDTENRPPPRPAGQRTPTVGAAPRAPDPTSGAACPTDRG